MANIILDYDGTIHDCAKIYVPAFYTGYKYLTDRGLAPVHEYSYNEVSGYLGYSVNEMWNRFMPELERSHRAVRPQPDSSVPPKAKKSKASPKSRGQR